MGPAPGCGRHDGGFLLDRDSYFRYDYTKRQFDCRSTKSAVILSDMSQVENGPFAAIPGSDKSNFSCPFDMDDASNNPMAVPVLAQPGDVIIFSEEMIRNAFSVTNSTDWRSVFVNYMTTITGGNHPG